VLSLLLFALIRPMAAFFSPFDEVASHGDTAISSNNSKITV
jgi:hypothetical protein